MTNEDAKLENVMGIHYVGIYERRIIGRHTGNIADTSQEIINSNLMEGVVMRKFLSRLVWSCGIETSFYSLTKAASSFLDVSGR